ncbi:MAG: methyltransferase domain-containing protein [Rhodospirillales bacterium]|jgi:predicted O-methyltransferase YrrM|nr:methyltransferase domain-containing protein [Rhodospirillales bacterium]MBT4041136.1 methyltransferase domain-containing protein [Rhodospirillales bacterium]MBT4626724.1 methyltransferase domain-containing protein [Rhodospirillales bacterium]MBT5353137.1 methyltransferase domain-containing protein [Rhodospirillales bacterium]MBT5519568.1 methyltransferase domain-containing protein [Rhodospirillales bacterium]
MDDKSPEFIPVALSGIEDATRHHGFDMASEYKTGTLLRTLAASKPGGRFLEVGTGTGLSAAWLLDGMDKNSHLISVELDAEVSAIANTHLGDDSRLSLVVADGNAWLRETNEDPFDLIFADAMPGKYETFGEAWSLLKPGGLYIIDDMLPQPNWPDGHASRVAALLTNLDERVDCHLTRMAWASGIVVVVKK